MNKRGGREKKRIIGNGWEGVERERVRVEMAEG